MKVLFAVSNSENNNEDIVDIICNEYQKQYKKIISYKRVFYYDAIVNEIKQSRDNQYDRIIISEDFEKNINDSYESEDLNLYKHLDEIIRKHIDGKRLLEEQLGKALSAIFKS